MVFILRAQPHAQSLFLFPIVFGINLIHFFDDKKVGAAGNSIGNLFRCFDPLSRHLTEAKRRTRTVSKSATFLATESVISAPFKRGETKVQFFWQGKVQNSSPILRWKFLARKGAKFITNFSVLARKGAKFIANFSATNVTSLPSHSLSLSLSVSLSLSPSATHAQYRKRFLASYNTVIPKLLELEKEIVREVALGE